MIWTAWLRDVEWRAIGVTEGAVQVGLTTSRWVVEQWKETQTCFVKFKHFKFAKSTTSVFTVR